MVEARGPAVIPPRDGLHALPLRGLKSAAIPIDDDRGFSHTLREMERAFERPERPRPVRVGSRMRTGSIVDTQTSAHHAFRDLME